MEPYYPADHLRLEQVSFQLVFDDQDAQQDDRVDPALGGQRNHNGQRTRHQQPYQRHEGGHEDHQGERQGQRDAHDPQDDTDHDRVDGGHRDRATHVVDHRQPGGVPGPVHAFGGLGPQRAEQPGPDPLPVLDQEEHDEKHQDQTAEELGGDLAASHHGALDERFVLAEVAGDVVQKLLDVAVLDVEGRPGQPRFDLLGGMSG